MCRRMFVSSALTLVLISARLASADSITFGLGTPTIGSVSAVFDVTVDFVGSSDSRIESFQLSVSGSDELLTDGIDFGRFSFLLDSSALPDWEEFAPLEEFGTGAYGATDPISGPFLSPTTSGAIRVGTLSVDLTGITPGTDLLVTLNGGRPGLGTDAGGTINGAFVPSMVEDVNQTVAFAEPTGVTFQSVPAPSSFVALASLTGVGILAAARRRKLSSGAANSAI